MTASLPRSERSSPDSSCWRAARCSRSTRCSSSGSALALAATAVGVGIRHVYAGSLVQALRARASVSRSSKADRAWRPSPSIRPARGPCRRPSQAPEPAVRATAAGLLGRTSVDRAGGLLIDVVDDDTEPSVRVAAFDALTALGGPPRAAAAALASLRDPDDGVRAAAVRAYGAVSTESLDVIAAIPAIDELVDDPSPNVRASVAYLLGSHGPDERSSGIVLALLDGDEADRVAGLDAVRRIGDPVPITAVHACLVDPSARVRRAAVGALAAAVGERATTAPDLIAALDDDSGEVRGTAARALAAFPATPAGLFEVLDTGSVRAQGAALVALRGHGPDVRVPLLAWTKARMEHAADLRRARSALVAAADPAPEPASTLEFLIHALAGCEADIVDLALGALVVLGTPEAGGVIRRSLRSVDPEVRAQAIETLDSVGDRGLTGALVRLLEDDGFAAQDSDAVLRRLADDGIPGSHASPARP